MQIAVLANEVNKEDFQKKKLSANIQVSFAETLSDFSTHNFDAYFILDEAVTIDDHGFFNGKPTFVNSVVKTLEERTLPENFSRINAWPTFLHLEIWEVATKNENKVRTVFDEMEWKYITVADEPGLVSARIIAMIINEAYFALDDDISSKEEIDIAMKLGTNYPYGPFEWAKKIGLNKIYGLLEKLSKTESRYNISSALKNELTTNI